jgi:voltage-gated potassium channel Kch
MKKRHLCFIAAAVFFVVFIADILIAKVQVLRGENIPVHLGDTLQFLVFFLAATFFVIGTLGQEKARSEMEKPNNNQE